MTLVASLQKGLNKSTCATPKTHDKWYWLHASIYHGYFGVNFDNRVVDNLLDFLLDS